MTVAQHTTRRPLHQVRRENATTLDGDLVAGPGLPDASAAHDDDRVAAVETLCIGEAR